MAANDRYRWRRDDITVLARDTAAHADLVALAVEALHLPGKHSQKSHGHGARGQEVSAAEADITDGLTGLGMDATTAARVQNVNAAFQERYGVGVTKVALTPADDPTMVAQIHGYTLQVNPKLVNDTVLGKAEAIGFLAPGEGSVEGLITHELGHVVLQGGNFDRRAVIIADKGARKMGGGKAEVSDYARRNRMEQEASLFAHYHRGGAARAPWVVGWGDILHEEMGVDRTPIVAAADEPRYVSPGFVLPPDLVSEFLAAEGLEHLHPGHGSQKVHGRRKRADGGGPKRYTRGSGTADDPVVTNDAWAAAEALGDGKHVQLESPDEVGTLLDRLHAIGLEAEADGSKAKLYDLCKVSVARTNLFCGASKGVARIDMPQFRGRPRPGSPADSMDKLADGKVDLSRPFIDSLRGSGIGVSGDTVDASHLKATQRELDGVKVAGMMKAMQSGKLRVRDAFFVSRDNYVVDGHHLWAATVGREFSEGTRLNLDVQRIDADILDVLDRANSFTSTQGLPRAGMGALRARFQEETGMAVDPAVAQRIYTQVAGGQPKPDGLAAEAVAFWDTVAAAAEAEGFHLAGKHDQKRHGKKVAGMGGRAGMGDIPIGDRVELFKGGSAEAHLVVGADGSVAFTPERQALHDKIVNDALAGKTPTDDPVFHLLGGGPAAGKSTMVSGRPDLADPNNVIVNSDDMKAELPEYQQMIAAKNPNAAWFAHEESSYLAGRVQAAAFENRLNITADGIGNGAPSKLQAKIGTARAAGYRVQGHYVTVPTDVAVHRANVRGAQTGRYVPETLVRGSHAGVSATLPQVYRDFDSVDLFDTRGSAMAHVMQWRDGSFTVHDQGLWDEFVAKGGS